jgi:hypothetical protein
MDVTAGQSYKLLVDILKANNSGFNLTFNGTATIASTLPLRLVDFTVNKQKVYNQLFWQTANEFNTKEFELERSTDAINFQKFVTIRAVGSGDNNYGFNDNTLYPTKVFYRLKMTDRDGSFTYSPIRWVNKDNNFTLTIYPNPASHFVNIGLLNAALVKSTAKMYDVRGKLVKSLLLHSAQNLVNISSLSAGQYFIKFEDGTVKSFMKK